MTSLLNPDLSRLLASLARLAPALRGRRTSRPVWSLPAGQARTLVLRRGQALRVLHGRAWLTTPGDARDHVVAAGQDHVVAARALYVLEALDGVPVRFTIERTR